MVPPTKILFVCVENSGRSQIAEGFLKTFAPEYQVSSAGTRPSSELNPIIVEVMSEVGIDIQNQKPKELTNQMIEDSISVNMGCMDRDSCPALFVKDVIDWNIEDPKGKQIEDVRKIRDQIKTHVLDLIKKLKTPS